MKSDPKECLYCQNNETLHNLMIEIAQLSVSRVFLFKEQTYRGRCLVAYKDHVNDLNELSDEERNAFMADVVRVTRAMDKAFHPEKINYGAYSDKLSHLHFHLAPKYVDGPDYGGTFQMNPGKVYLTEAEYQELIDAIKKTGKKVCEGGDQGYKDEREAFERLRKSNTKLMEQVPFVHRAGYQTLLNSLKDRQEALISEGEYDEARELIAAELAGMDEAQSLKIKRRIETRQLADKVIELFKVNEDNPAKEQDPCTLLAWLVLLRENYEGEVTTLESLEEAVAAGDYEAYGLMPSHRGFFREEAFEGYLNRVKQMAYDLPVQYPLYGGYMTSNFYLYESGYYGHTGIDLGGTAIEIVAAYSGRIKGKTIGMDNTLGNASYGNKVVVQGEMDCWYCHLLKDSAGITHIYIENEDFVLAGELLGLKGNSGNSTAPHLHYEVRYVGGGYETNMSEPCTNPALVPLHYDIDPNDYIPQNMRCMFENGVIKDKLRSKKGESK